MSLQYLKENNFKIVKTHFSLENDASYPLKDLKVVPQKSHYWIKPQTIDLNSTTVSEVGMPRSLKGIERLLYLSITDFGDGF